VLQVWQVLWQQVQSSVLPVVLCLPVRWQPLEQRVW